LPKVADTVFENNGEPPLEDAKKALDEIIKAIFQNIALKCILTAPNNGMSFGKPFIIKGLNFSEQLIPELSLQEKILFGEMKMRLERV